MLGVDLLGHLKGHNAPKTVACQKIRPLRLNRSDFFDIVSRHILDTAVGSLVFIQTQGL